MKTLKKLLFLPLILVICFGAGLALSYYATGAKVFDFSALISNQLTLLPVVLGGGGYVLFLLSKMADSKPSTVKQETKTKEGKKIDQFFDSRWVSEKELKTEKKFMFTTWSTLHNSKDGILIRSEVKGNNAEINMYSPIHTMIIGTTGTGKTQKYIEPSIQILSSTQTKPSFVITDPKGELFEKHSHKLKAEGYDVKVFDLRRPYQSSRWNPMDNAYVQYHRAHHLQEEVITHVGVNPADLGLKIIAHEYNNEWYEYNGIAYPNKEVLDSDLRSKRAELIDQAENDIAEIASTLCPIQSAQDPVWERGAQEFIRGTMLAMLEDSADPRLDMTRDKFNCYNLAKIANHRDSSSNDNPYGALRSYFMGRPPYSKVLSLVSNAINNAPTTTKSYMGIVSGALALFNDNGICFVTSGTDMDFSTFAERPTALFIIIPDEKESRHKLATLLISQLYKKLVDMASTYPGQALPRNVYFLLDEFANLPKIENIDTLITVGRSRHIYFSLVVQSFNQLNSKYGDDIAAVLKGNCPIKIFIGTDDPKTCEEFSTLCGNVTIENTSTSESKAKDEKSNDKKDGVSYTTSISTTTRPLIYPDELTHISRKDGTGDVIVKILNEFPIRVKSTPAYATPMFDHILASSEYIPSRSLDEEAVSYSIIKRNSIVLRPKMPTRPINPFS